MRAIAADDVLVRPAWARLRYCRVRGVWLFLVPEQVLYPCPQTQEVLAAIEAPTRFGDLIATLSAEYDAPASVIANDLQPIVGKLVEDGYVRRLDA